MQPQRKISSQLKTSKSFLIFAPTNSCARHELRVNKMKSLVSFLLGALLATVFWFFMGYLQVDSGKMGKLLHHDEVANKEVVATNGTDADGMVLVEAGELQPQTIDAEPAPQPTEVPEPQLVVDGHQPATQPSIVGRWRIADPVGNDERKRMLQIDEFGNIKDFYNVSLGFSNDYVYLVEGDIIKYGSSSRYYSNSFQFKVRRVNGKDYLEIYNDTNFGGKWVRSE